MISSILVFVTTLILLVVYSSFDVRERKVPNQVMLIGGIVGVAVTTISGHIYDNLQLHMVALLFAGPISYILFRLGAFGGADVKALITVTIVSPGIEFIIAYASWVEAIIAAGIEAAFMLAFGYFYWHQKKKSNTEALAPPLLPLLLVGYLVVQVLALV